MRSGSLVIIGMGLIATSAYLTLMFSISGQNEDSVPARESPVRSKITGGTTLSQETAAILAQVLPQFARVAVVIPLYSCSSAEKQNIINNIRLHEPCQASRKDDTPLGELGLVFQGAEYSDLVAAAAEIWHALGEYQKCFTLGYSIQNDLLSSSVQQPQTICASFMLSFHWLRFQNPPYDHFFRMSEFVIPQQPYWCEALLELAGLNNPQCHDFWMLSGTPMYPSELDSAGLDPGIDFHLGLNGLYCLTNRDFHSFRGEVMDLFPPYGCSSSNVGNSPAHSMFQFRFYPSVRARANFLVSKFVAHEFILNCGPGACYDLLSESISRNTFFFDNEIDRLDTAGSTRHLPKYYFSTKKVEDEVSLSIFEQLGRSPHVSELRYFTDLVRSDALPLESIGCFVAWLVADVGFANDPSLRTACGLNSTAVVGPANDCILLGAYMATRMYIPIGDAAMQDALNFVSARGTIDRTALEKRLCTGYEYSAHTGLNIIYSAACAQWAPILHFPSLRKCEHVKVRGGDNGQNFTIESNCPLPSTINNAEECEKLSFGESILQCHKRDPDYAKTSGFFYRDQRPRTGYPQHFRKYFKNTDLAVNIEYARTHPDPLPHPGEEVPLRTGYQWHVWTTDMHAAPAACSLGIFDDLGAKFTARVDFGNCIFFKTLDGQSLCAGQSLKVLGFGSYGNEFSGMSLWPCPSLLKRKFFEAYKDDKEFMSVDVVTCSHPSAHCELYMPFNKTIVVNAAARIDFGRADRHITWRKKFWLRNDDTTRWSTWLRSLRMIASNPLNVVSANNRFDVAYIEYFTGIKATFLPNWCGELIEDYLRRPSHYLPNRTEVLIAPYRNNLEWWSDTDSMPKDAWPTESIDARNPLGHPIFQALRKAMSEAETKIPFVALSAFYPQEYELSLLRQHPAIVFIPYQTSTMSFFEFYRMNIPLLVPSKKLLISWMDKYGIMWEAIYGTPQRPSDLPPSDMPYPNDFNVSNILPWVDLYDFYTGDYPHLLHFDSWTHALELLVTTNLTKVSYKMRKHNIASYYKLVNQWRQIRDLSLGTSSTPLNPLLYPAAQHTKIPETIESGLALLGSPPWQKEDDLAGSTMCAAQWQEYENLPKVRRQEVVEPGTKCGAQKGVSWPHHLLWNGTWRASCENFHFDSRANTLRATCGGIARSISDPFRCVSEISLAPFNALFDGFYCDRGHHWQFNNPLEVAVRDFSWP